MRRFLSALGTTALLLTYFTEAQAWNIEDRLVKCDEPMGFLDPSYFPVGEPNLFESVALQHDFAREYMFGDADDCDTVSEYFGLVVSTDSLLKEYMSTAIAYLPKFRIVLGDINEYRRLVYHGPELAAGYSPGVQVVFFDANNESNDFSSFYIESMVRHEMRHAFWNAVNEAHSTTGSCSSAIFGVKSKEVSHWFKQGDAKIVKLFEQLNKEAYHPERLSLEEKAALDDLRWSVGETYRQHYLIKGVISFSKKEMQEIGLKLKVDEERNIDSFFKEALGKIKIKNITMKRESVEFEFDMLDPLFALCEILRRHKMRINDYPSRERLHEREAYLFGDVPVELIRHFYSEVFEHGQEMLEQLKEHPAPNRVAFKEASFKDLVMESVKLKIMDPMGLGKEDLESVLGYAGDCFQQEKELDIAAKGLISLLSLGLESAQEHEVSLWAARVLFKARQYEEAVQHYQKPTSTGQALPPEDGLYYAQSLMGAGRKREGRVILESFYSQISQQLEAESALSKEQETKLRKMLCEVEETLARPKATACKRLGF